MSKNSDINCLFKFTWIIDNFSMWPFPRGTFLKSPDFVVKNLYYCKFYVTIYPRDGDGNFISCNLHRCEINSFDKPLKVDLKIEIEDREGKIIFNGEQTKTLMNGEFIEFYKAVSNTNALDYYPLEKNSLNVRFFINTEATQKQKTTECLCQIKFSYENTCFKWVVTDFDHSNFTSNRVFFYHKGEPQFKIQLNACDSEDDINIYIEKLSSEMGKFNVLRCRISLLKQDGIEGIYEQGIHWYDVHNKIWTFPKFLKKSSLNNYKLQDTTNYTIKLLCDFSVPRVDLLSQIHYGTFDSMKLDKPRNSESNNTIDTSSKMYLARILSDDLKKLLDNNTLSDITLKIGEELFKAHKNILSARSPVFGAMFHQGMSESKTGVVEIQDMETKILTDFLTFLYSGEVDDISVDDALKLLLVAEKYQVGSLKEMCCSFLIPALNINNVCEILLLAEMISEESLKTATIAFIKENASEIIASKEWLDCVKRNAELTTQITSQIIAYITSKK